MTRPNMVQVMEESRGAAAGENLRATFNRIALPPPAYEEIGRTTDGGYMLMLDYYGVRIRMIHDEKYPLIRHPHILQPLGTLRFNEWRFDILPSIRPPVAYHDNLHLVRKLRQDGIDYWDDQTDNAGYIPAMPGLTDRDFPVVLDMGSFESKPGLAAIDPDEPIRRNGRRDVPVIDLPFDKYDDCMDTQDRIYGPLRRIFNETLKTGSPRRMNAFWSACAQAHEDGLMFVPRAPDVPTYETLPDGTPRLYRQLLRLTLS